MRSYDLIVVGAGPGGLMAARIAGENGLKTALLERKTDIAAVRRLDSGILSPVNEYTFGQILTFNPRAKKIGMPVSGFTVPYDGPYKNMFGFEFYSPGGLKFTFGDRALQHSAPEKHRVGIAIDKGLLLQGLLREVEAAGVDVFAGLNVDGVAKQGERVVVSGNGEAFCAPFVIAADGCNSRLARLLGMNLERRFLATHVQFAWHYDGLDIPDLEGPGFVMAREGLFSINESCYSGRYHISRASFNPGDDLAASLQRFVDHDPVYSAWFRGGRRIGQSACTVNMLSPMPVPLKDNVLFIGDAAWVMEIENSAALCCGWKAANTVTVALQNGSLNHDGLAGYLDWWQKYFFADYGDVDIKPFEVLDFVGPDDIDYLFSLIDAPLPPTLDFYKLMAIIGETFGGLLPVIGEQRPALMARIMERVDAMEELESTIQKRGFPNR